MEDRIDDLAEKLAGASSSVRGFTHSRVLRGVAQQVGGGVRRDIARQLDISPATVSKAVARMAELGLVEEQRQSVSGPGHPVTPLTLSERYAVVGVAVLNIGGSPRRMYGTVTSLAGVAFPAFAEGAWIHELKPDAPDDFDVFSSEVEHFAQDLIEAISGESVEILGCGLTVAGQVVQGRIKAAIGTRWADAPEKLERFSSDLSGKLGSPVFVDNDITSLAVRKNLRPDKDAPSKYYALLAPIDRGVGGAVIVDSKTWTGAHGIAAEPGHLPVASSREITYLPDDPDDEELPAIELTDPICQCDTHAEAREQGRRSGLGPPRHVEAFASPRAIERRAVDNGIGASKDVTAAELASRPRTERDTSMLFYQGGRALGVAIVSIINWFDPRYVSIYIPAELHETNRYLAGSYYLRGVQDEVLAHAQVDAPYELCRFHPTPEPEMHQRLAVAAGYLVFRGLLQAITNKKKDAG